MSHFGFEIYARTADNKGRIMMPNSHAKDKDFLSNDDAELNTHTKKEKKKTRLCAVSVSEKLRFELP